MKKDIKLYNALFPLWMILAFPWYFILAVLPGNFLIDSIVLFVVMHCFKIASQGKWDFYKRHIFKIFGFGLLSDVTGAVFMFGAGFCLPGIVRLWDEPIITVPGIIIASGLIYFFNFRFTFKSIAERKMRIKLALIFAIATAPYTFVVPSELLY